MNGKKNAAAEFISLGTKTFTGTVIFISLLGWLYGDYLDTSLIFYLGSTGLSHLIILQVFIFSSVNTALSIFIERMLKSIMIVWQMIVIMFACLTASAVMAAGFGWILLESHTEWIAFTGSFIAIFITITSIMFIKMKITDKKYERLLSQYKEKRLGEPDIKGEKL